MKRQQGQDHDPQSPGVWIRQIPVDDDLYFMATFVYMVDEMCRASSKNNEVKVETPYRYVHPQRW